MAIDDCRPPVRRPRRSNSLNDVGRLIVSTHTVYDDREVRAHAVLLSNSEANAWSITGRYGGPSGQRDGIQARAE
jgi:hypothetical protein